jgi:hypothetical protein
MKLGTEDKKKVYALVGLGVVAAYMLYTNVLSTPNGSSPAPPPRPVATAPTTTAPASPSAAARPATGPSLRRATPGRPGRGDDFHPSMKRRQEDRIDPATIDPTLRLDLLAKVQAIAILGGARNIFQFGTAPPPPAAVAALKNEPKVLPGRIYGPLPPEPPKPAQAKVEPPPPPINLKYYGFSSSRGGSRKTAFFLDGEEILVAPEGGTVKQRYKVVRVGATSVLMEDTTSNRQQSLPLQEDIALGAG